MDALTAAQVREALGSSRAFEAGQAYFEQRRARILDVRRSTGSAVVESEVKGSQHTPYHQDIAISPRGGRFVIEGDCSCYVGWNCKHVAAALLQWRVHASEPDQPSPAVGVWLNTLTDTLARASDAYPPDLRQRLIYVLDLEAGGVGAVRLLSVRLDKTGAFTGKPTPQDAHNHAHSRAPAKYLRASDLSILRRLAPGRRYRGSRDDDYVLSGLDGNLLADMAATGRCRWQTLNGPVVQIGPPRQAKGAWTLGEGGRQRFHFSVEGGPDLVVLAATPPHYFNVAGPEGGPPAPGLSPLLTNALMSAPEVPPIQAEEVAERLAVLFSQETFAAPVPQTIAGYEIRRPAPRPVARLGVAPMRRAIAMGGPEWGRYATAWATAPTPVLRLAFDYEDARFEFGDGVASRRVPTERGVVRIARDPAAEDRLASHLAKLGLRRLEAIHVMSPPPEARKWFGFDTGRERPEFADFLLTVRPALEAQGWTVDVDEDFPSLARIDDESWAFDLAPSDGDSTGLDWFDLQLGVRIDGERLDILPALIGILRRLPSGSRPDALQAMVKAGKTAGLMEMALPDGRILVLPLDRVAPILEGLLSVWRSEDPSPSVRLSRYEAADLATLQGLAGAGVAWTGDERLPTLARELKAFGSAKLTPLPAAFAASLRPYQQTGLDWLQMLRRTGFGGVLADDMGLGKTVQTLAHLAVEQAAGRLARPALVVAPTSVLPNWRAETERFAPTLRTLVLRGAGRAADFARLGEHDLVITSYPLLARDRDILTDQAWSVVILDEGQMIRNPVTAAAQAAFALKADQRLLLSGTPVENHLGDVWSLMHFLNPGLLGDAKSFVRRFRTPIEKQGDAAARTRLARRLSPFLLRRGKDQVARDLPPKTEIAEPVDLNPAQTDLYEATRLIMHQRVRETLASKGLGRSAIVVLDALLKLRQVCCDPRLVKTASAKALAGGSAKLQRLLELVEQLNAEGRKALVFSQFTSMLELIRKELDARGLAYVWLTGDTVDRETPVKLFQSGKAPLFLISLKAGGTGLNLTGADTVILYDPWWNPAVEAQAIDRAHRIGQTKPVFVHRLIATGTIEEKMIALQARKRDLAQALWEQDGATLGGLTEADIETLFEAMPKG